MISRGLLRQTPSFPHAFSGNPGETSECPDKTNGGRQCLINVLSFLRSFAAQFIR